MFRFLQAFYWMFFCRQEKPHAEPSKIHPYRVIPRGWCVWHEEPDDENYKVAHRFLLNEDILACCISDSDSDLELPQFWLLKGSKVTIDYVGDQTVTAVYTRPDRSHWMYLWRYSFAAWPKEYGGALYENLSIPEGLSFFITFDQLELMTRLHD